MPYSDAARRREYAREWMARRRREWVETNGPCGRCGSWSDLELHHRDPDTKISHRIWSWSAERRNAELQKCEALCGECHRAETRRQLAVAHAHGTNSRYTRGGCRCDACRGAHAAARRARRSRVVPQA